jgi:hypothetical protein
VERRLAKSTTTAGQLVGGLLIFAGAAVLVTGGAVMLPSAASFAASGLVVLALSRLVNARGRVGDRSRASGPHSCTRRARQQRH